MYISLHLNIKMSSIYYLSCKLLNMFLLSFSYLSMRYQHLNIMLPYCLLFEGGTWKYFIFAKYRIIVWQMREML